MTESKHVNKLDLPIENMVKTLIENKKIPSGSGFPIVSAFLDENFVTQSIKINSKFECAEHKRCNEHKKCVEKSKCIKHVKYVGDDESVKNKKCVEHNECMIRHEKCNKTDIKNHAEYKCDLDIKKSNGSTERITTIITNPPCNDCFNEIFKNKENIKIYYFIDDVRKKIEKSYLKEWNDSKKIVKKSPSSFVNENTEYNVYYIIMSYLGGCLTQELRGITIKEIEDISKKWVNILKKVIKTNRPSSGQINIKEVWKMIENIKNIDIKDISHLNNPKQNFKWITD